MWESSPISSPTDDGFMVVPVWDLAGEVQIGSVVWEDPLLSGAFGSAPTKDTSPPVAPTTGAAFVAAERQAAAAAQASNAQIQPKQDPQSNPNSVPNHAPIVSYPEAPETGPNDFNFLSQGNEILMEPSLGWWEESAPILPQDLARAQEQAPPPPPAGETEDYAPQMEQGQAEREERLRSPEDILSEIYAEAEELEADSSNHSSPFSEWLDSADDFPDSATDVSDPAEMDAAAATAVLNIEAEQLPPEVTAAAAKGQPLNLLLRVKGKGKGPGPKLRATVALAEAPKRAAGRKGGKRRVEKRTDAKERKKAQNRMAATKYREKRRVARDVLLQELSEEEARHQKLKKREEDAMCEINYLRDLLDKIKKKNNRIPVATEVEI